MAKLKAKRFDTSAFLDDDEVVAEYLTAALEEAQTFDTLFLVGWRKNGGLFMASTEAYIPDIISTLEIAKMEHIRMMVGDDD